MIGIKIGMMGFGIIGIGIGRKLELNNRNWNNWNWNNRNWNCTNWN